MEPQSSSSPVHPFWLPFLGRQRVPRRRRGSGTHLVCVRGLGPHLPRGVSGATGILGSWGMFSARTWALHLRASSSLDAGVGAACRGRSGRRCHRAGLVSRSFQGVNQQVHFQNQDSAAPILPLLFPPRPLPAAAESLPGHIVPRPSRQTAALPPRAPAEAGDGFSAPVTRGRTRQGPAGG